MTELDHRSHTQRKLCPICGHKSVGEIRFGVNLTPLKARILDRIASVPDGISSRDLIVFFSGMTRATLKAHSHQINEKIGRAGYRIYGRGGRYRLVQTRLPSTRES